MEVVRPTERKGAGVGGGGREVGVGEEAKSIRFHWILSYRW